jgi:hypothetical protein
MKEFLWSSFAVAAVILPPWNLLCWGGGYLHWRIVNKEWPSFDLVFWLPAQIPLGLLLYLFD